MWPFPAKSQRTRFLNLGGVGAVLAGECEGDPAEYPDLCEPGASTDYCLPPVVGGDPDVCPDFSANGTDMCPDDSGDPQTVGDICDPNGMLPQPDVCSPDMNEFDVCRPEPGTSDPDVCIGDLLPNGDVDQCLPDVGDADVCMPALGEEDLCNPGLLAPTNAVEICNPGGPPVPDICDPQIAPDRCDPQAGDLDVCEPLAGPIAPDICDPQGSPPNPDVCIGDVLGDGDVCEDPFTDPPDVCSPTFDPDVCNAPGAADEPSLQVLPGGR